MSYRLQAAIVLMTAILVAAGCGKPPAVTNATYQRYDHVVARVDTSFTVTFAELFEDLQQSLLLPRGGRMTAEEVRIFLEEQLVDTLAYIAADTVSLDEHYQYFRTYRQRYYDYLIRQYAVNRIQNQIDIDSSEVVEFYEGNQEVFLQPEQVLVYHILIAPEGMKHTEDSLYYRTLTPQRLREETGEYTREIYAKLEAGEPFKEVAQRYSHDVSMKTPGGRLGWVKRGVYEDPFDTIAFNLDTASYSEPYETANGWHIIYVEEHKPEQVVPLDSNVFAQIEGHLRSKEADRLARPLIDSLEQEINLEFHETLLDTNLYFAEKTEWFAILNQRDTIDVADMRGLEERYRSANNVANTTSAMKRQMAHDLARRLILVQAAEDAGIDTLPEVVERRRHLYQQQGRAYLMTESRVGSWQPTDSMIEAYYNAHLAEFDIKKPLVVQHIIAPDSASAEFIRDQAEAGADFLGLAEEFYPGEPSLRRELADLGAISSEDVSPEFYEAARITPVDGFSRPVKTEYGWHIIHVVERNEAKTLSQARHEILPVLKEQHEREVFVAFRNRFFDAYRTVILEPIYPVYLRSLAERQGENQ